MAGIKIDKINKFYGTTQALFDINLDIEDGEFVVFVGPSGCGKSTLLRTLAGLEGVSSGRIEIGGRDVTTVEPADRDLAMVFQSYALYPHMTVRENMEFGMKVNGFEPDLRKERIAEAARVLQLEDYLDRKPGQLSGGQRQRVAIGRAIVKNPSVFLFDEPLSNLDAKLRVQMRVELEGLHKQLGATMIYVTHDQVEAMTMADKIVVLNRGRIEQVGSPMDLYHKPNSRFVAEFIGSPAMNVFSSDVGLQDISLDASAAFVGCRPEHIEIVPDGDGHIAATVHVKERLGGESLLYLGLKGGGQIVARVGGDDETKVGAAVSLRFSRHRLHQFDEAGRAI
ncbi:ABC-type sugar / sn-glycerol-3-phosphate import ATP-binding protein ugpC [Dinoroseobacter shibae DFL 12 = DSM 16493]|uniref:ABC-type sugar / sn-glycerol-3-phosphate import ATP-binding protein ugpC n=1 Tax=Dinoroseobacter shibae (strain DSM 16493 / NCIMB 14021 / DFL 12) TaxID=398580 RepID=A8LPG9_DINSH|nr:sn-glycerol-3-phosphate ABC transporter ATP-binding protein UgpC [Dinoroseobacter shibae]ABV92292.1 ABC-type sugar / sn-glycerol-3-phosphate import ATP-binding protein ugpC [Dinoroseobacter shibae DFL 12 = DSM 16493]URF48492.1 sn-glycerol-3-phosphate ABC transporter ATP-binding protein UgpC [Dinoroseobacter shibae]URF52805.1 sn-glycerol-3-phosphate ABC transporter ATP-binding protein UgpC [Dinoroseobacter shibae]